MKTLTRSNVRQAMQAHAIGISEAEELSFNWQGIKECEHCLGEYLASGFSAHTRACILNPARNLGEIDVCQYCDVAMSLNGLWKHEETCDGDAERTIERLAKNDLAKIRKAKTFRDNIQKLRGIDIKELNQQGYDLDEMITRMSFRLQKSNVSLHQISEWETLTKSLWSQA